MSAKKHGTAYLVGSGERATLQKVASLAMPRGTGAKVAASFAAVAGDPRALAFMQKGLGGTFAGAAVTRFAVPGEDQAMEPQQWRRIVEECDVVFLSGGDPALGAKLLRECGADEALRAARARGATLIGVSAGAIMLGAFWGEWPEQPDDGGDAALVACTGVVPDLVVDCHNDDADWDELRVVAAMHSAAKLPPARFYGIPSGGALVVDGDGTITHEGIAPFVLGVVPGLRAPSSSSP